MSSERVDDGQIRHLRVLRAGGDELRADGLRGSVSRPPVRGRVGWGQKVWLYSPCGLVGLSGGLG